MADSGAEERLRAAAEAAYAQAEAARLERLRALILSEDRRSMALLASRIKALEGAALDPEAIRSLLADNLIEVLRDARDKRGKALSATLAPVVGGAIRAEIRDSRDAMVEALRPIAGRMVRSAVTESFKKLIEDVNARLDALASAQGWGLRLRAWATGRSVSQLALAELRAQGVIARILLIDRRSGGLIAQWPEDSKSPEGAEMIGGMIAAILAFSEDALRTEDEDSELRSLDLNGRAWILHPQTLRILAIEEEGASSAEMRGRMAEAAGNFLEGFSGAAAEDPAAPQTLAPLARALLAAQKAEDRPKRRRGRLILGGALLLALLGLAGWTLWEAHGRSAALDRVRAALYADPALESAPFQAVWMGRDHIEARVVLPPGVDAQSLEERLKTAAGEDRRVVPRFARGASAEAQEAEARLRGLSAEVEALRRARDEAEAALAALRGETALTREAEEALHRESLRAFSAQEAQIAALTARQADLSAFAETAAGPEARLRLWAARTAIFFPDGADLSRAENLDALDEAAALLQAPGAPPLRVVGYADRTGSAALNERLARERAQAVAAELVRRGAPPDRVIAAGRLDPAEIVETHGPGSRNRRVQFEPGFSGE